jgi:hypothetical protein
MSFFRKRAVAVILAILVVLAGTYYSAYAKLGSKCSSVESGFYNGVTYSGYLHPSINGQLENISDSVQGMITICENYGVDTQEISKRKAVLDSSLDEKASISSLYSSYSSLSSSIDDLENEMTSIELSERYTQGWNGYVNDIASAQQTIKNSGYNDSVDELLREIDSNIIASYIMLNTNIKAPEYFK